MEFVTLDARRRFRDEKMQKVALFESERLTTDLYCLRPEQEQRVHTHSDQDKVYVVLEGEAMFDIDGERQLLPEGSATIARAGAPHGVSNLSSSNLVLLVIMAPPPR